MKESGFKRGQNVTCDTYRERSKAGERKGDVQSARFVQKRGKNTRGRVGERSKNQKALDELHGRVMRNSRGKKGKHPELKTRKEDLGNKRDQKSSANSEWRKGT